MSLKLQVAKLSDASLSYENCVILPASYTRDQCSKNFLELQATSRGVTSTYIFTALSDPGSSKEDKKVHEGTLAVGNHHRTWAYLGITEFIRATFRAREQYQHVDEITMTVDAYKKDNAKNRVFDSDRMAEQLCMKFHDRRYAVSIHQPFMFKFDDQTLKLTVSGLPDDTCTYRVDSSTRIFFDTAPNANFKLSGKSRSQKARSNIINPNFNFQELGIGGLDEEFKEIFRRAFASRNLQPDVVERMGVKHVKGILLHGPPGCGKTLTARQIGKMLSAREPKIVNGPEILNKFVGESESNIRKLFEDAEEEQKRLGNNSGLHIIIFDEIDAICKQRGSVQGASGVHDTVVNQLLSKIDGVEPLNNILVIGMTNRPDLIDEALLRPGRLEVKKEIGLPDESGRLEVLKIHTSKMSDNKMLADDVDLVEIAALTKNFSGAELAGLVRGAQSCAIVRHVKVEGKVEIDRDAVDDIKVTRDDFMASIENDIKPAYGLKEEEFEKHMRNGVLVWDSSIQHILDNGTLYFNQVKNCTKTPVMSVLLTGRTGSGKTALAVKIALDSRAPFLKICSPQSTIGFSEHAKCQYIKKIFDDAFKSEMSCVVVDDIEKMIDYNPVGNRYSNLVAQTLIMLLNAKPPIGKRLLIIATSSNVELLEGMGMVETFDSHLHVPSLTSPLHVNTLLDQIETNLTNREREAISKGMSGMELYVGVKHLIRMLGTAEQSDTDRAETFISVLQQDARMRKR